MKNKPFIFFIIGTVLVFVLVVSVFLVFPNDSKNDGNLVSNSNSNGAVIENSTKVILDEETTFELKPTSKPAFNVGEKYVYNVVMSRGVEDKNVIAPSFIFDVSAYVDKIERVNNTDYYVLKIDKVNISREAIVKDKNDVWHKLQLPPKTYGGTVDYINKETGNITRQEILEGGVPVPFSVYDSWMLCLKENLRWTSTGRMIQGAEEKEYDEEGVVKGIEKMNGRKCFVVEIISLSKRKTSTGETLNERVGREMNWIDIEKRILVKKEIWANGILILDVNLISYEKAKE